MGLRDIESKLPPGFRFYPSDEELVCHYLTKKVANERVSEGTLVEVDLHTREPWELPEIAKLSANEWYFFSFRDRKYATGSRTNRATKTGYWKATGKDRIIYDPLTRSLVGMRKTLVFYRGRAPNGVKSSWVMHEFRLESPHSLPKEDWVLCRVFNKGKSETMFNSMGSDQQDPPAYHLTAHDHSLSNNQPAFHQIPEDYYFNDQQQMSSPFANSSTAAAGAVQQHHQNQEQQQQQQEDLVSCNSSFSNNLPLFNYSSFLDFPREVDSTGYKCGDSYGFPMDLGHEDYYMCDGELKI